MLADDNAVADVALARQGIVETLAKGAIHLSMSTISVALSKRLSEAHAHAGSASSRRRSSAVRTRRRQPSCSSSPGARPLRSKRASRSSNALGQKTVPISSDPAAANLVKLSGNFLLAAAIEALGEAIALVGKAGIDRRAYVDLLTSTIFPAPAYKTYGGLLAEGRFQPAAFAAPLGFKDIRLALEAAESLRVPCRSAACCTIAFCGSSRKAATASIGPPSAALQHRTLAMRKRQALVAPEGSRAVGDKRAQDRTAIGGSGL